MGVEFYHCSVCEESRYEEYVGRCTECGKSLCTSCLVNDDIDDRYAHSCGLTYDSSKPELMKRYEEDGYSLYKDDGTPYYEDGDVIDDSAIDSHYCPYCSGESVDDNKVLSYLLEKYSLDKNKVWAEIQNK